MQDSLLESTTADDDDATNSTENADRTLENEEERMGGLFTQTYR